MKDQNKRTILSLMIGSCTCRAKTPEVQYHNDTCCYRLLSKKLDELDRINTPQSKLKRMSAYFDEIGIYTKANYCLEIIDYIDELEGKLNERDSNNENKDT